MSSEFGYTITKGLICYEFQCFISEVVFVGICVGFQHFNIFFYSSFHMSAKKELLEPYIEFDYTHRFRNTQTIITEYNSFAISSFTTKNSYRNDTI